MQDQGRRKFDITSDRNEGECPPNAQQPNPPNSQYEGYPANHDVAPGWDVVHR